MAQIQFISEPNYYLATIPSLFLMYIWKLSLKLTEQEI